jgi:uncharacterized membrane protein YhhN
MNAVLPVSSSSSSLRTRVLAAAVALSALLAIASGPGALGQPWLLYVFKPLATLLVIVHAWPRGADTPRVRHWLLVGLGLSLLGDVALMWPQQGFLPGLVAFLLAHLAYIVAFTRGTRFIVAAPGAFALYALLAGGILAVLWPSVPGELKLPVLAYVACLASMAAQAAARWWTHRHEAGAPALRLAAIGGALFVGSDGLLATDRFHAPLPAASLWILATYWLAQWCIASSLRAGRTG